MRPHPHIGLATLTYLLDGALFHRDSLKNDQEITPGAVNLMVAGRGVVHSERSPQVFRASGGRMAGLQLWLALPQADAERRAEFRPLRRRANSPDRRRRFSRPGRHRGLGRRDGAGRKSFRPLRPRRHLACRNGAAYEVDAQYEERALYLVSGDLEIEGTPYSEKSLIVLKPGSRVAVRARSDARFALVAGDPLDGPRYLWWNFVAASRDRIVQAREDWISGRFLGIEGDAEFIPAPELKAL